MEKNELKNELCEWKKWKNRTIATAVYPALALLNHSCAPNIQKYFNGCDVVAVATRNIMKGKKNILYVKTLASGSLVSSYQKKMD